MEKSTAAESEESILQKSNLEETTKKSITKNQILAQPSTPLFAPIYRFRPYKFINRQYFIIQYETDPEILKRLIPYPLKPVGNTVIFDWMDMGDNPFGHYFESGIVVPVEYEGQQYSFPLQMFLNSRSPVHSGREYFGFSKRYGLNPRMFTREDTLIGTLSNEEVVASMPYKYKKIPNDEAKKSFGKTQICCKIINGPDFKPEIFKLCTFKADEVTIKEAWEGPCTLDFG